MPRPRSDIDRRIVQAARERFLAEGVDGASLRAIARTAKTNVGMIFYYFPTKDDIFLAVVEEVYAGILRDLEALFTEPTSLRERLRRVSIRIGTLSNHELDVVRLVVREALLSSARFQQIFARFRRGHIPLLVGALKTAIAQGEVDESIPMPILIGCVFGVIGVPQILRRAFGTEMPFVLPSAEETAEIASALLFRGVGAPAPTARVPKKKKKTAVKKAAGRRSRSGRRDDDDGQK